MCCGEKLEKASQFLLLNEGREGDCDWEGTLWGSCFRCSGYMPQGDAPPDEIEKQEKRFRRASGRAFERLASEFRRRAKTARSINFHNIAEMLQIKYPGSNKEEYIRLAKERVESAATIYKNASDAATSQHRVGGTAVYQEYVEGTEESAKDVMYTPPSQGWTLTSAQAQHLTCFGENMFFAFVCRDKTCMHYGRNSEWVASKKSFHFKCPDCKRLFQPWTDKPMNGQPPLAFQFIVGLWCPLSQRQMLLPVVWPHTKEFGWLLSMAELHARDLQTDESLEQFLSKSSVKLSELLEREAIPMHFRQKKWKHGNNPDLTDEWDFKALLAGYHGETWGEPEAVGFKDFDVLIPLIGNMIYAGQQLQARL
jgi:hypothetical protein